MQDTHETTCTCTLTPHERVLNRDCPEHGDEAEAARHRRAAMYSKPLPQDAGRTISDKLEQSLAELGDCAVGLRRHLVNEGGHGDSDVIFAAVCGIDALVRDVQDVFQALPLHQPADRLDPTGIRKAAAILRHLDNRLSELKATDDDHFQIDQAIRLIEGRALRAA